MFTILGASLAAFLVINIAMFFVAFKFKSDKLTDVSYAFSFIILAVMGLLLSNGNVYHILLATFVILWALRIGGFLLYRVIKVGKDQRFDGMREDFVKFGKFWVTQAITVWILMIPSMFVFQGEGSFTGLSVIGVIVWLVGLFIESLADLQKFTFGQNPKNKNKWIESGIWKYSRHPNYFGEIAIWVGVYIYAFSSLSTIEIIIGAISPLSIVILLLFVSGIPILEKSADKKWGSLKEYQQYKKRTSVLVPLPLFKR